MTPGPNKPWMEMMVCPGMDPGALQSFAHHLSRCEVCRMVGARPAWNPPQLMAGLDPGSPRVMETTAWLFPPPSGVHSTLVPVPPHLHKGFCPLRPHWARGNLEPMASLPAAEHPAAPQSLPQNPQQRVDFSPSHPKKSFLQSAFIPSAN